MTGPPCAHERTQLHDPGVTWCDDCRKVVNPWSASCLACRSEFASAGRTIGHHACDPTVRWLPLPGHVATTCAGTPIYLRGLSMLLGHVEQEAFVPHHGPLEGRRLHAPAGALRRFWEVT